MQAPRPWPYGSMEEWRSYRASLEQQKGPYSAFLRAEANRELARISRCASEPARLRPTIVPPKDGWIRVQLAVRGGESPAWSSPASRPYRRSPCAAFLRPHVARSDALARLLLAAVLASTSYGGVLAQSPADPELEACRATGQSYAARR